MRARSLLSLASLASLSMFGAACSSSSAATTPTDDTGVADTGATDTAVADSGASDTGASDTGAETSVDAGPPTCASYCATIQSACSSASQQQFSTMTSCLGACFAYPAGAAGAMSGDSLACRAYHATLAVTNPGTHCPHAGPTGGDKDPNGTTGVCGEPCEAFCDIATAVCTGANAQWTDRASCVTACKTFGVDVSPYSTADVSKNDMGCRFYHLSVAATDAPSAALHCPHIVATSPVCTM